MSSMTQYSDLWRSSNETVGRQYRDRSLEISSVNWTLIDDLLWAIPEGHRRWIGNTSWRTRRGRLLVSPIFAPLACTIMDSHTFAFVHDIDDDPPYCDADDPLTEIPAIPRERAADPCFCSDRELARLLLAWRRPTITLRDRVRGPGVIASDDEIRAELRRRREMAQ